MKPTILTREETHVIGITFTANVTEDLDKKLSGTTTEALRARKSEIHNQVGEVETNLGETYGFLYGSWLSESGYDYAGFDFEYWDERYKPEQEDNEIDIYVPLFK